MIHYSRLLDRLRLFIEEPHSEVVVTVCIGVETDKSTLLAHARSIAVRAVAEIDEEIAMLNRTATEKEPTCNRKPKA